MRLYIQKRKHNNFISQRVGKHYRIGDKALINIQSDLKNYWGIECLEKLDLRWEVINVCKYMYKS